ncbi:hypothetical protein Mgra_00001403 [Meloidogyne graminicola]|uniref:Uncharacterized protein n=1 Tax=Meloidogyne graminicola TaxID=189291 RepID=A0A8T0A0U6_9BILA|nr:hypothetical protein Mgra_00001403 [Meloidogyne graminicola]
MSAVKEHQRKGFGTRSNYEEIETYATRRQFNVWWQEKKKEGWRLNTRYDSARGTTSEYWCCSQKQDGIYICPARFKFIFKRGRVKVLEAKNRPHDHTPLPPNSINEIPMKTKVIEPLPMQTAQIVDLTPRLVTSTSTQSTRTNTKRINKCSSKID